jgi:hypothetical protein
MGESEGPQPSATLFTPEPHARAPEGEASSPVPPPSPPPAAPAAAALPPRGPPPAAPPCPAGGSLPGRRECSESAIWMEGEASGVVSADQGGPAARARPGVWIGAEVRAKSHSGLTSTGQLQAHSALQGGWWARGGKGCKRV